MLRPPLLLFAVAAAILFAAADSFAQGGRTFGGGSLGAAGGSSAFGSTGFGSGGMGGGSFGASAGQSAFGGSGFGQQGGQSAFGQSAFGAGQQTGAFGGQNANQAFIGRGAADMAAFFGGAASQAAQNSQRPQRSGNSRSSSSSTSTSNARPEVRIAITASPELQRFVATNRPPTAVTASNVSRALARKGLSGVSLVTENGVAILEGAVGSSDEKLLAEKLAAIEPGVRRVDNRLAIESDVDEILPTPQ
jgi:osmotically-inducible protein OsmY